MLKSDLAKTLEATLLFPDTTYPQIEELCEGALLNKIHGVCVAPSYIPWVKQCLKESSLRIVTVVGFPHGNLTTYIKTATAHEALLSGAHEIDMVMNIGAFKSGDMVTCLEDIKMVALETHSAKGLLKVIVETALLPTEEEKILACKIVRDGGADFVKTSTGFAKTGANFKDIVLFKSVVGNSIGIKAAGGIRSFEVAKDMIEAGASRIGCSSPKLLLDGVVSNSSY